MGGRTSAPFLIFQLPTLEEGGVPEGRGGYSPLGKGQRQALPLQSRFYRLFPSFGRLCEN